MAGIGNGNGNGTLTQALALIAGQAQAARPQTQIIRARGSIGGNTDLEQLRGVFQAFANMPLERARGLASALGLKLATQNGVIFVQVPGAAPDSTQPQQPGTVVPNFPEDDDEDEECPNGVCAPKTPCRCGGHGGGKKKNGTSSEFGNCLFLSEDPVIDPTWVPIIMPLSWNCERWATHLAPCQIRKITRVKRRYTVSAATDLGTLVQVTWDTELDTPQGWVWYRLVMDKVDVSHDNCIRQVIVRNRAGAPVPITDVAIQSERIYLRNGKSVFAWTDPKPEDPEYIRIRRGRCWCARLCECVPEAGRVAILVLVPALPQGERYTVIAKGERKNWCKVCGPCPVEEICDHEPVDSCKPCDCAGAPPIPPVPEDDDDEEEPAEDFDPQLPLAGGA